MKNKTFELFDQIEPDFLDNLTEQLNFPKLEENKLLKKNKS